MADFHFSRCNKVRTSLSRHGVKYFLVTNFTNVTWLTGFTGDDSYLLIHPKGQVLLSDFRYAIQIAEECPGLDVEIRTSRTSLYEMAHKYLHSEYGEECLEGLPLGVEADSVTLSELKRIETVLTKNVIPLTDVVETLRQVKDKYEIGCIREAGKIARKAFEVLCSTLTAGKTEKQIADELEHMMRLLGAQGAGFPSIVAVGSRAALCHAVPGDVTVDSGDILLVDWGAVYKGYTSDLTRTVVTGRVSPQFRKLYKIVLKAQREAISAIRPGVTCGEIDKIARDIIGRAGYGKNFDHGLGHGIGLEIHERPRLGVMQETILRPGMVVTVEPGIYIEGWGGIRIEDDVLVTRTGSELLTDVPKELEDIIIR